MKPFIVSLLVVILAVQTAWAGRAPIEEIATDPYVSALLINADTGEEIFAENGDAAVYPASALKLMVLLIVLEQVEQGSLRLDDMVQVTDEAYRMGGSQVYLDPKEQFPVEEMLYALMVQSANDAAVALATHVAGSKDNFVALMNRRAEELGMKSTRFYTVHGLPPAKGQEVDVTTARDFAILCRELARRPEVFAYTGTAVREFRDGTFIMRNHNHLLNSVAGCDGFKTGYFRAAGFSIAATAQRNGTRMIALVMGSSDRKVRDAKAAELLAKGFAMIPPKPAAAAPAKLEPAVADNAPDDAAAQAPEQEGAQSPPAEEGWGKFLAGLGIGFALFAVLAFLLLKKKSGRKGTYLHRS
ncbi:MAG: D-alanyl-D-alanine carboxypeptidase [Desulfobulbaceae bacterium]|jgi:D-alanyl-D-alanine carboxypeptidase (penicillin-binding protein 5/6)|nr:D-alanyl-D-alanine carboxypeptidase [Desulfobulbaceae bacterium]